MSAQNISIFLTASLTPDECTSYFNLLVVVLLFFLFFVIKKICLCKFCCLGTSLRRRAVRRREGTRAMRWTAPSQPYTRAESVQKQRWVVMNVYMIVQSQPYTRAEITETKLGSHTRYKCVHELYSHTSSQRFSRYRNKSWHI